MNQPTTTYMEQELASQPEMWKRALSMTDARNSLPPRGASVAVVGCGTSWFMAQSFASLREDAGHGVTDAFTATEARIDRPYDALIVISRSGTTTEIAELLDQNQQRAAGPLPTVAVVGATNTPVADKADSVIDLSFADEQSVVQTRFATTALMFLRASIDQLNVCEAAIEDAERILAEEIPNDLINAEQYSFLGRGWTIGLATEAALKMRESCQAWTEDYSSMEYRHGPIAIAAEGRITWQFGAAPEGLADQVARTGARFVDDDFDPMADLVRLHRVALATSAARGLNPDEPRNLTRSVILE
ncbi:SIS domain-containing protein [Corynebacterium glyciniphilum]|uniref:SIS domain-containing protein n=1 Tax=Corynebacterium glyciniphilum TaxID=1404244 RepID=UPI0011AB5A03|nr:SIS domain-containing protein [Corynebacterium glyciniphilum]